MDDFPIQRRGGHRVECRRCKANGFGKRFKQASDQRSETIRDWNLRAVYGAFNAMKNRDGAAEHPTAKLAAAYIGARGVAPHCGDVMLN